MASGSHSVILPTEIWDHVLYFLKPTEEFIPALVCQDFYTLLVRKRVRRGDTRWITCISPFCHSPDKVLYCYNYFGPEVVREMVYVAILHINIDAVMHLLDYSGNPMSIIETDMYYSVINANCPPIYNYLYQLGCPVPYTFIKDTILLDKSHAGCNLLEEILFKDYDLDQVYIELMKHGSPEQIGRLFTNTDYRNVNKINPCWLACYKFNRTDVLIYMHTEHNFELTPAMALWSATIKHYDMLEELIAHGCKIIPAVLKRIDKEQFPDLYELVEANIK